MQNSIRLHGTTNANKAATANIRNFSLLSSSIPSDSLAILVGGWISKCKEIIEERGGAINKYLEDGFPAYWAEWGTRPNEIVAVISALKELQEEKAPDFRFVVHLGSVAIGGLSAMGEESVMGTAVNFIFRLEELASSLGVVCGLSNAAQAKLGELVPFRSLGEFEVKGFEGKCPFFAG
jgi:class 3 adenylate cyclase